MLYKMILGYFRAKFIRLLFKSIFNKEPQKNYLKTLTLIEYALELLNAYRMDNKKNKYAQSQKGR